MRWNEEDSIHTIGCHHLYLRGFDGRVSTGGGEREDVTVCTCGFLDRLADDGKEAVRNIRNDETDGSGKLAVKDAGSLVWRVVQLTNGSAKLLCGVFRYIGMAINGA